MLLEMEPRLFDIDIQLIADSVLMIIFLIFIFLGVTFAIKFLIKEFRKK